MNLFLMSLASGACFLLGFLLLLRPEKQRLAYRWLAFFVWVMGSAFLGVYWGGVAQDTYRLAGLLNPLQLLLAPCLLLCVLHFTDRARPFKKKDTLHFIPFILYWIADLSFAAKGSLLSLKLFSLGSTDLLLRDGLPLQLLLYIGLSYIVFLRGKDLEQRWVRYLLLTLLVVTLFWINDALFGIAFLLGIMPLAYTGSVFLLAYLVLKRRKEHGPAAEPAALPVNEAPVPAVSPTSRMDVQQLQQLSGRLEALMTHEKIFLDNELSLPLLARRLAISVHDTSYLINEVTGNNYYSLVNSRRVEEAKRLLALEEANRLSMVGIAFAAGFNSKTAFNTAFKKWTGLSPSAFRQEKDRERCTDG